MELRFAGRFEAGLRVGTLIGLVLAITAASACSDKVDVSTVVTDCILSGIRVSPPSATLHVGDTLRASANYPACGSTVVEEFRWRSNDTSIAIVDSLSGLIRARQPGSATIIAADPRERTSSGAMALQVAP